MSTRRSAGVARQLLRWQPVLSALAFAASGPLSAQARPPEASTALRNAVQAWIAGQRDAYRRGDVSAFQPCPDRGAVVLRDVDGEAHTCAAVQAHMRDRMGGDLDITVDSIRVHGDSGFAYNTVHFHRRVTRDGIAEQRDVVAVHRDLWRRPDGVWTHIEMVELAPQRLYVDGLLVAASPPSLPAPPSAAAIVLALDDTINAVWLRHDTVTLARLFADDFSAVTARGRVIGKREILAAAAHADETHTEVDERQVRVLGAAGDVAVLTRRITDSGRRANGEPFTTRTRVTTVYARGDAGWRVVAEHETSIPP